MEHSISEYLGGAFIYSEKPEELAAWYKQHLCIDYHLSKAGGATFASFYYKNEDNSGKVIFAWSIIKSKYRNDDEQETYMVHYRVNDLRKLIAHLLSLDIQTSEIQSSAKGIHTTITDLEGNHIIIWEEKK
ncbi:MAG: hypothetical protein WCP52_03365 [Bacteroidota bacterium]